MRGLASWPDDRLAGLAFPRNQKQEKEPEMKNKKVIASFKCVLAMLSCLMLGACRPQMAKAAFKTAGKIVSRGGGKAEQAAARFAVKGVVNPQVSGRDFSRVRNLPGSSGVVSPEGYGNARRAAAYYWSRQNRGNDERDQENQSYYYR